MRAAAEIFEALVCRHIDYSDTSRVYHLLSRTRGPVHMLAKGVRKKAGENARLELLNLVRAPLAAPPGPRSELYLLSGPVETLDSFPALKGDLRRYAAASFALELALALSSPEDADEDFFLFVLSFLRSLSAKTAEPWLFVRWFELRALSLAGFDPREGRSNLSAKTLRLLEAVADAPAPEALLTLVPTPAQKAEIAHAATCALDFHLGKTLKSLAFLQQML